MALARPTQKAVPFANSGVKNAIPETATGSNLASLQEGFPTVTMTDVDQGGMPPQGQDMNGILFDVTTAIRYQQAGGLFPYDATFAAAIDGYPLGAILTATDGSCLYQNTVSGNQTDPENVGTGWSQILSSASIAGKQDALSPVQMDAVNSGITAARVAIYDGYAAGKQDTLTFDNTPTNGSSNPVTSNGIYAALGTKQDTMTVDAVPTSGSTNPVQSGGVYDAVDGKVSKSGDTMTGELSVVANYGVNDSNASHIATTDFTMKRRSCYVGQSGNGVASPWFKVGTYTTTTSSATSAVCLFDVASTYLTRQVGGQLRVFFRLNANRVLDTTYTKLEWVTTYGNLNPDDFVLLFNSDSSSITLDLYVKCATADLKYAFKVISEKPLLTGNSNAQGITFNLTNNVSTGSLASLPAGTQIVSKLGFTAKKPPYVVVIAGQSNAAGRGEVPSEITAAGKWWRNSTSSWCTGSVTDVDAGTAVPVSSGIADPMQGSLNGSGSFMPALAAEINRITGCDVYIINVAQGGKSSADWAVSENTSGSLRNNAKTQFNSAIAALNVPYEILGTVWLQGETDVDNIYAETETISQYQTNTTSNINWFLGLVGGGFFASKISYNASYGRDATVDSVNNALATIVNGITGARIVTDLPLSFRQEGLLYGSWHYKQDAYDRLGKAIAEGILYAGQAEAFVPPKIGKRIAFVTDVRFPDHDAALAAAEALEPDGRMNATSCYPQACCQFVKDDTRYLIISCFLAGGTDGNGGTPTSTVSILTIWNIGTGGYVGYRLATGVFGEGVVAKTESSTDYLYMISTDNKVVRKVLDLSAINGSTLTDDSAFTQTIPCNLFLSYCNGTWAVENPLPAISRNKSMTLYDDSWSVVGMVSIPRYEMDVLKNYTDTTDVNQWSLPRPQGIAIGCGCVCVFRGGMANSNTLDKPTSNIGVDKYSFDGSLIKTSVCDHSLFLSKMRPLCGITNTSTTETECEGGFVAEDGTPNLLMVIGGSSGKIVLTEEFSEEEGAVEFSDCIANNRSDLAYVSDKQDWSFGSGGYFYNPWTGVKLQTVSDVVLMCAVFGLDDISISPGGNSILTMTCGTKTLTSSDACTLNVKRYNPTKFFVTVSPASGDKSRWLVTTASTYQTISSVTNLGNAVTVIESGTGYKRYSDGTQECWGGGNTATTPASVNFPKAFSNVPIVTISGKTGYVDMQMRLYKVADVSASSFTPVATNIGATAYSAVTYQYYARGTWSA